MATTSLLPSNDATCPATEAALAPAPAIEPKSRPHLERTLGPQRSEPANTLNSEDLTPQTATILLVDDEPANVDRLRSYLEELGNPHLVSTHTPQHALRLARRHLPDVILLDLHMPATGGFQILSQVREDATLKHTPVIILTDADSPATRLQALRLGANEFLGKPVDPSELVLRLRNTLAAKSLRDYLAHYSARLEREVRERTRELEASRQEAMQCLARAAEYRDDETGRHVVRVGRYVAILAHTLGFAPSDVKMLEQAAQLHDVGKIGIPDSILLKPGPLNPNEFDLMKEHCQFGRTIIQPMTDDEWQRLRGHTRLGRMIMGIPSSPIMKLAASIAESHHERWDGSGYPHGLRGEDIPIEGRITAVADVFDALSTRRPYKPSFPIEQCISAIVTGRGKHFDPTIVDAFLHSLDQIMAVQNELADQHDEKI